jgi:glycosyltransferase involved in cell wall biosynthesis
MKFWYLKKETDMIHGHHVKIMALSIIPNFILRLKSIYTVHGSYLFFSKSNAVLLWFIFKFSDKIIFVNKMLYDVLPKSYKRIIKGKYEIILNGVEINYKYKKTDIYKKFNIEKSDIICFHPARFVREKNHIRLISGLKPLMDKDSRLKLVLAGSGQLQKEIENHVKALKLEKSVIFLGLIERDEVYNFLENCDLFLMPSISEGLNISFLEAISMNTKIVVSNIEQFTYPLEAYNLNPKTLNVTFVNPLDNKSIGEGVSKALKNIQNFSYNCNDFSLDMMISKYENIQKNLYLK